jgi:hypothetical protein
MMDYPLPGTGGALSWAQGYGGNFSFDDIPVTIQGTTFTEMDFNGHILPDDTLYPPMCAVTFQNLATGEFDTHFLSGGTFAHTSGPTHDPLTNDTINTYQINGTFDTGSIVLNITRRDNISRRRHTSMQSGSVLTLT